MSKTPTSVGNIMWVMNLRFFLFYEISTYTRIYVYKQGRQDLNPRPTALKAAILPTELLPLLLYLLVPLNTQALSAYIS